MDSRSSLPFRASATFVSFGNTISAAMLSCTIRARLSSAVKIGSFGVSRPGRSIRCVATFAAFMQSLMMMVFWLSTLVVHCDSTTQYRSAHAASPTFARQVLQPEIL
ncbi:hypothetical protein ABZT51_50635 [Streptomyces sp. NPDC005373]|uniref:hypothetical protein n=1 Tax=Streptomyces sp. NPDC005373 TaxID=3156879 RepID=UPI0033BA25BD